MQGKKILFLTLMVIWLSACGDNEVDKIVKNIDKPSNKVTNQLYTLAKECWQVPNKISDIGVEIKDGESYKTVISKEDKTFTSSDGNYSATVIGAHYVTYNANGDQIAPKYASLVTARIKEADDNSSTVIIYSVVKSAREDVLYWLEHDRCR